MTSDSGHVPDEFDRVERLLAGDAPRAPPPALRRHLLGLVRFELRRQRRRRMLKFAAAAAAVLLVGAGFVVNAMHLHCRQAKTMPGNTTVSDVAERLRILSSDLTPIDSLRRAMLTQTGAEAEGRDDLTEAVDIELKTAEQPSDTDKSTP
ncbi:MAG: hypothetical protein JW959_13725 [Pirellulales bacterium]|nr:hypothetical protein [Pirellulales bacterium]